MKKIILLLLFVVLSGFTVLKYLRYNNYKNEISQELMKITFIEIISTGRNKDSLNIIDKGKEKLSLTGNFFEILNYDYKNLIYIEKEKEKLELIIYNLQTKKKKTHLLNGDYKYFMENSDLYILKENLKSQNIDLYKYNFKDNTEIKIIENINYEEIPLIKNEMIFFSRNGKIYRYDTNLKQETNLNISGTFPFEYENGILSYYSEYDNTINEINLSTGKIEKNYYEDFLERKYLIETPKKITSNLYVLILSKKDPNYPLEEEVYIYDKKENIKIKLRRINKKNWKDVYFFDLEEI